MMNVYNLSGQKIRSLVSGSLSAGDHAAVWNGKDENGNSVASGVYIVKLTMGGITAAQRMTFVK